MEILGLDVASSCGIGWVDPAAPPSTWRAAALECFGKTAFAKIEDFDFDLRGLLASHAEDRRGGKLPDFAVIEHPLRHVAAYGKANGKDDLAPGAKGDGTTINARTVILANALVGNAIGILNSLGIPYALIDIPTWRAAYYGSGVKPNGDWDKKHGPKPAKWTKDWKELAVRHAMLQGVPLPIDNEKAAKDAAEAIGIAVAWKAVNEIPTRHQHAFMQLRMGNRR